jgi:hypothetical protein
MNVRVLRPFIARFAIRTSPARKNWPNDSPQPVSGRLSGCFSAIVESPAIQIVIGSGASASDGARTSASETPRSRASFVMRQNLREASCARDQTATVNAAVSPLVTS